MFKSTYYLLASMFLTNIFLAASISACAGSAHSEKALQTTANSAQATTSSAEEKHHQVLLKQLREQDDLKPALDGVHPVTAMYNREAIIPPQCYTKHEQKYNPCYVCHQDARQGFENLMNDGSLQRAYSFSELGLTNHWKNLFEDRSERVASISDEAITSWVSQDNYSALADKLKATDFDGWIPDLKNLQEGSSAFDKYGFAKDGSHWVAFNYKPFPSTFWPTNGSTDDVMIRLPAKFRQGKNGNYNLDVYRANLAIVEATVKGINAISSLPINEKVIGKDLDGNKQLSIAHSIVDMSSYVGQAKGVYKEEYLYPVGTEFFHTVRYLGFNDDGTIGVSRRMKEVRYMKKWRFFNKNVYKRYYDLETMEKEMGHLPGYTNLGDYGLDNSFGWSIQGFIEDRKGELRVSTYEENTFCMGCHSSIGGTIDKTFSFARKVEGTDGWGYINLKGMPDAPNIGESQGEIVTYLQRVGGGSEFRNNDEMRERWFTEQGDLDHARINVAKDVYDLIVPSKDRALELNKAYRVIVEDQDFIYGRDATVTPPVNVFEKIDNSKTLPLPADKFHKWDIRLDWSSHNEIMTGSSANTSR